MVKQNNTYRRSDLIQLLLNMAILMLVAFVSGFAFIKFDLTEEKRHTLTPSTIQMLDSLEETVFVRCYLHGEFPARFKRLEKAIRERLDEFDDYAAGNIEYEFIDIYESGDDETIGENEQALYEQGLTFSRIAYEENGVRKFQNIWPGAIIAYQGREVTVSFFKSESPEPSDEMVNTSINNIEYELASHLRKLMRQERPAIAVLDGHRELRPIETADLIETLSEDYDVERVAIKGQVNAFSDKADGVGGRINKYDLLIVAKPDSVFSRADKIILDQFIMNGGAVLWMIDPIITDLDSLRVNQQTLANTNEMGLYDMLFDYGVRMNRNLIIDYQCAPIMLDSGPIGGQRNMQMSNWYFAPVVIPSAEAHPICANLDPIHFDFVSSIDLVGGDQGVKKSILLESSDLSLERKAPVRVNPGIVDFDIEYFRNGDHRSFPLAVLLEGEFTSNFKGRLADTLTSDPNFAFREKSVPTRMIVIGDGDIGRNKFMAVEGGYAPLPLGYERYAGRVVYDNKEFLLNAVNYLLDDPELISIRSRAIELRKLDPAVVKDSKKLIQVLNVVLPLLSIALMGAVLMWLRKRRFAKKHA